MKKEKELSLGNMILIILGVAIIFLGVVLIANLSPIKEWVSFHEFLKGYGANASLVLGGVLSLMGVLLIFVSLKTNR